MDCLWNHAEAPQWRAFHEQCAGPLPQSWRYGEALASLGTTVHRAWLLDSEGPVAAAQFVCRRIAGYLSLALCSRGPLWRADLAPDRRREAYRLIRRTLPIRPWRVPLYSPEQIADELDPIEVKDMRRVMTGYSTVMLDLDQSAEQLMSGLEPKWRNRLRRAQGETGLQVFVNANRERCDWLWPAHRVCQALDRPGRSGRARFPAGPCRVRGAHGRGYVVPAARPFSHVPYRVGGLRRSGTERP
jgi:hypothetical protein